MDSSHKTPAMSQKIFNSGLSVETVSVYLLCCNLADSDTVISTNGLLKIWTGTKETLLAGLENLEQKNIILKIISDQERNNIYKLTAEKGWI